MSIELRPLTTYDHECVDDYGDFRSKMVEDNLGEWVRVIEVEARERILQARIAELEAVLAKFDERWLMDGELGFCTACGVSIEGGESHKPECWLAVARAAIDAVRKG